MTASMEQAATTMVSDRTTVDAEVNLDASGENVLLRDDAHRFDFGSFDAMEPGDAASSSTGAQGPAACSGGPG